MPPRHVYWTILIDKRPTAFRARTEDEILPTLRQLQRTNKDVVLRWFARGRYWQSPAEALAAQVRRPPAHASPDGARGRPRGSARPVPDRRNRSPDGPGPRRLKRS